jgi:hypothetical protein
MDVSRLQRPVEFQGDDETDTGLCQELFRRAADYIAGFSWCKSVIETHVGHCVGGIFALVLFRIEPARPDADEWIWVVVGDLPPAYIAPASEHPRDALADYIDQMARWVEAVRSGGSVDDLIPVNAAPTAEWATALATRLDFLRTEILPTMGDND